MNDTTLQHTMSIDGFLIGNTQNTETGSAAHPPDRLEIRLVPVLLGSGTRAFPTRSGNEMEFVDAIPDIDGSVRLIYKFLAIM